MLYHITTKADWLEAKNDIYYSPKSLQEVSFIHCSTKEQVLPTANRRFQGISALIVLVIDEEKVSAEIKFEDLSNMGEKHPHIYGELPLEAVVSVLEFEREENGNLIIKGL